MRESRVRVRCVIGLHHSAHRSHCTDVTGGHIDGCDELNILAHVDIDIREFDEGQAEEHGLLNGDLYLGRDRRSDLNPNCYGTHVWRQQKGQDTQGETEGPRHVVGLARRGPLTAGYG